MASREFPADVAAALDRVPEAGDRFAALPPERQAEWLGWIGPGPRARARAGGIDEMVRQLLPAEEEVVEPAGPPRERYWWLWLLLLLLPLAAGVLRWGVLSRGGEKTAGPEA